MINYGDCKDIELVVVAANFKPVFPTPTLPLITGSPERDSRILLCKTGVSGPYYVVLPIALYVDLLSVMGVFVS